MRRLSALIPFFAACTPQTAQITDGAYIAFLPDSTSRTVIDGKVAIDEAPVHFNVDCTDHNPLLPDARPICNDAVWPPEHEGWAGQDGLRVMADRLEPWRGEALITSEGDVQIGFHNRLPGGEDFRFAVVVDPKFQPTRCVDDGNGGVSAADIDGDWIDHWSEDLTSSGRYDAGRLFYLNARAYQLSPTDTSQQWIFPQSWRAGYAQGKFGPEDVILRGSRYGLPSAYVAVDENGSEYVTVPATDLFYVPMESGVNPANVPEFVSEIERARGVATRSADEVALMIGAELDALGLDKPFHFEPMVHDNLWRTPDAAEAGLDGWVGMHYSWIRFTSDSVFEPGGTLDGELFLTLDALDSATVVFVQATFHVDKIKEDRWTMADLPTEMLAENGGTLCGQ